MKILRKIETIAEAKRAKSTSSARCYHVAAIFRGNTILSVAQNSHKTHPKIKDYKYHDFSKLHAELAACIKLGEEDCRKYSIAVIRIDRNGNYNTSCPCAGCKSVIHQLGFKKVYYTNELGLWDSYEPSLQ